MSQFNFPFGKGLHLFFLLFLLVFSTNGWSQDDPCTSSNLPISGTTCIPSAGTNLTATATAGVPDPLCGDYQGGDNWYNVIMPSNGLEVVVELTSLGAFDGALAVYSGDDCGNLTLLSCDDNSGGGNNALVRITDGCTFENLGKTYWIRVWENGNNNNGAYSICAYGDEASTAVNPTVCEGNLIAGDACCEAILLSSDELDGYCGNTGGFDAKPDSIPEFCAKIENNSWIAFVPSSNTVEMEIEGYNCASSDTVSHGGIQVHILTTNDCVNFTAPNVECLNPGAPGISEFSADDFIIGQIYYIHIDGFSGDVCDYRITLISGVGDASVTTNDDTICPGESTQLQAYAVGYGPYSYSWSPTTGLDDPTAPNPMASPTTTTNYTVTITGGTQPVTGSVEITVLPPPPTAATIDGHDSVCENSTDIIYQVNSLNANTYNWTVTSGDGTITSATDEEMVSIDWGPNGGQLCVIASNVCGAAPQDCITVTTSPVTGVTAMDPAVSCTPDIVDLSSIPLNITGSVGAISYHATQAAADSGWPIINPPLVDTTGTYYIRVQTNVNCYDVTSVFVDIEYVDVEVRNPPAVCQPNMIDLDAQVAVIEMGWGPGTKTFYTDSLDAVNMTDELSSPVVSTGGTYWLRFETANGCFDVDPIEVTIEPRPDIVITNQPFICTGGSVDLDTVSFVDANNANLVVRDYYNNCSFASLGLSSLALTNTVVSTPGDYCMRVESPGGCEQIVTITVTATSNPVGEIDGTGPVCPGEEASLFFDLNGTAPFNVVFSDGTTNTTLTGIMDGATELVTVNANTTYSIVSLTDATGCPGDIVGSPVEIQVHAVPTATISGNNTICGDNTLDITFNFTGNGPYDVIYSDGTNNFTLNGISDSHTENVNITETETFTLISVEDNNTCTGTVSGSATITHYPTLAATNINEVCDASVTGYTVSFEITGGDPASYNVTGNGTLTGNVFTSDFINNSVAYSFTVSDNSGCPSVEVSGVRNCGCSTEAGTMDLSSPIEVCEGTPVAALSLHNNDEVLVANDILGFVLHDNAGGTLGNILEINTDGNFNFLPGMMTGVTYYISPIAGPDNGSGSIDLGHVCTTISPGVPLTFYATPVGSISGMENICQGENAILTFNFTEGTAPFDVVYTDGTNNYTLDNITDNATAAVSPLFNTTYSIVSITDNTGAACAGTGTGIAQVAISESPVAENVQTICNNTNTEYQVTFSIALGDPATYTVSGPGIYDAATNIFTSNFIASGTSYSFEINDGNNCNPFIVDGIHICDCTTETVVMDRDIINVCDGTTAIGTYGGTPVLDGNDAFAFVLHEGNTNQLGNILLVNTVPEFNYNNMLDYGKTYYISAVAGDDDGSGVPILDRTINPCLQVSIGQPVVFTPIPLISIIGDSTICAGNGHEISFEITGVGPYDITYTDGVSSFDLTGIDNGHTIPVMPDDTTTYSLVSIRTTNTPNCVGNVFDGIQSVDVNVVGRPDTFNFVTTCNEEGTAYSVSFEIIGGNPLLYQVMGSPGRLAGNLFTSDQLTSGDAYYFEINDGTLCSPVIFSDVAFCKCTPDILPDISIVDEISCVGEADGVLFVQPENGIAPYTYEWSNGDTGTETAGLGTGWYHVTMTDGNECVTTDSIFLTQPDQITAEYVITDVSCFGGSDGAVSFVNVQGGAGDYLYDFDIRTSYIANDFFGMNAGTYIAMITDANGCIAEDTVIVNQPEELIVDLGPDQYLEFGDSVELITGFNQAVNSIVWSTNSSVAPPDSNTFLTYVRPWQTTTYFVDAENEIGCKGEGMVTVFVEKTLPVYIPNAFSPNGDGENDRFKIYTGPGVDKILSVAVFSRWGGQLYEELNIDPLRQNFGWNGEIRGRPASTGVYIYSVDVLFEDGTRKNFSGDILLFR